MSIMVQCVHCGAKLKARDTDAGKRKACPKCGKPIKVPEARGIAVPPPAPAAVPEPAPVRPAAGTPEAAQAPEDGEPNVSFDAPEDEAAAPATGNSTYQSGDQPPQSPVKWILALVLFLLGVGFCAFVLSNKSPEDKAKELEGKVAIDENIVKQNRLLYENANKAKLAGNKEEAIKFYRQLVANLEKLPKGQAAGLQTMRLELKALETGRPFAELAAEEKGTAAPQAVPAAQQPAATPAAPKAPEPNPQGGTGNTGAAPPPATADPPQGQGTAEPPAVDTGGGQK